MKTTLPTGVLLALASLLLLVLLLASLILGAVNLGFRELLDVLALIPGRLAQGEVQLPPGREDLARAAYIVLDIRLPRVVAAILAGSALAMAGTLMQGLFQNPLAGPEILGVSSGASFGAVLAVVTGFGSQLFGLPLAAVAGSLATAVLVYMLAARGARTALLHVILTGLAISSFVGGLVSAVLLFSQEYQVSQFVFWTMGGLGGRMWEHVLVPAPPLVLALVLAWLGARRLNLFALGEEQAHASGLGVEQEKRRLLVLGAVLTAMAISIAGPVGFVGLMIPHLSRFLFGPDHRVLMPASSIIGASFLLAADLLGRTIAPPYEINVGIITALLGGPYFLWLVVRSGRKVAL